MSILLILSLLFSSLGLTPSLAAIQGAPVNSHATNEARELLNILYNVSGKNIIAGQHDYLESPDDLSGKLDKISGQYAALHGYELGAISGQTPSQVKQQRASVVNSAIRWSKSGGLVTITYHESLPGTRLTWSNVQKSISQAEFDKYITPGTPEYKLLIRDIDDVAASLQKLSDAGVPVLWRPYHEMNGNWFWWGGKNDFAALWDIMYNRLVNVHGLNNLIWVWSPNAPNANSDAYAPYFPGLSKVDVLAADIYNNDYKQSYYDGLLRLAGGKPIAIGENGPLPSPLLLSGSQNRWAYFLTWGNMLTANNSLQAISSVMNSSVVVTKNKLQFVSRAPAISIGHPASSGQPASSDQSAGSGSPGSPGSPAASPGSPAGSPASPAALTSGLPSAPSGTPASGLIGEYFSNVHLSGTPLVRMDRNIDFNWRSGSPDASIPKDYFSVRWSGKIKPLYSEKYTISTLSDDGIRVWVDGKLLINSWINQSWDERKGSIYLTSGRLYDIKVEYYESTGDSMARLMWQSPSQAKETVPSGALFQSGNAHISG